ncbi:sugar-binding transcriptional regulator [Aerococcus sanguinicola]|uniref:sugar-binding transcriptional regulator n=1 Tax=unclassified Aerococcus TaxID=2618060 RepID=UPI0008A23FD0|nr:MULTISPECIES: sugar-binding domain-containing protein [unclassified Aerococcus]KAB0645760.1 sugar-binding transcriptional regulator [Aerococcus sanguinicola]MDK6856433.1 sugar-binding domain-containing protein [Aerococcus sp. UMB7533]OFN01195.1 hypothetical protein HMPREF2626_08005 [Aerococcus sp. HMSC062A02]OHO44337.1 hypothetical protein HMPREF2705_06990 [Aerococcus sp. HMSC035B07]
MKKTIEDLSNIIKEKFALKHLLVVPTDPEDSEADKEKKLSLAGAEFLEDQVNSGDLIGLSWGETVGNVVDQIENKNQVKDVLVLPVVGGPSHIDSEYHVNTLAYKLGKKLSGKSIFINATVIQETIELADGIQYSRYFSGINDRWEDLDIALVGVGGPLRYRREHWRDLINNYDLEDLRKYNAIGDCCCRFYDIDGNQIHSQLDKRTIGIELDHLATIPLSIAIARDNIKAVSILALLRGHYVNGLITDQETIEEILRLDNLG